MENIEFKGFKLIYANGNSIDNVLQSYSGSTHTGILYLVRTDPNGKDGYLVLNGKVYGSAEEAKALIDTKIQSLDATATTTGTYISGTIVEEDGKLKSFTIDDTMLGNIVQQFGKSIEEISGSTIDSKINAAIEGLDATIKTGTGCTLPITIVQENGKLTNVEITTEELDAAIGDIDIIKTDFKAFTANTENDFSAVNQRINNLDATVSGTSTNSPITVKVEQVDGKLTGVTVTDTLGTASRKDVNTVGLSIPENNEDNSGKTGLTTAAQVENFVKASVADLTGAMHFVGAVTGGTENYTGATKSGDVIIVTDTKKEYVYDGSKWVELGDEGLYVTKSTTIAGVNLQDNITKDELLTALNVANGAQVNVLEGVKVNGTKLDITKKEVDIAVTSGADNGTISVNGANVAVTGLKSAAYKEDTYFDKAGTATTEIAKISGTTTGNASANYGITVTTTQANGKVTDIKVNDDTLKTNIDDINTKITNLGNEAVKNVNGQTGNNITLTGADIAVGADVDGTGGTMTSDSTVSTVLADIYTKLNTANANAYTGITADDNTVTVTKTTNGHSVAVKLKGLSSDEMASGLIQLVSAKDGSGIYGQLFFDGTETVL